MYNDEDIQLEQIVNNKGNELNIELQKALESYTKMKDSSILRTEVEYQPVRKERNTNKKRLNNAIIAVTLSAVAIISAATAKHQTKNYINNNNVVLSNEDAKDEINERVQYYEQLMNMDSDSQNKIEIMVGRDNNYDPLVDYNTTNLARHLIEASEISQSELRSAILAAYRIINEPYRTQIFNEAINKVRTTDASNQESLSLIGNNTREMLSNLGYNSWEEYHKDERNNITTLRTMEDYIGGRNR